MSAPWMYRYETTGILKLIRNYRNLQLSVGLYWGGKSPSPLEMGYSDMPNL
jgi:hypothetical protein